MTLTPKPTGAPKVSMAMIGDMATFQALGELCGAV